MWQVQQLPSLEVTKESKAQMLGFLHQTQIVTKLHQVKYLSIITFSQLKMLAGYWTTLTVLLNVSHPKTHKWPIKTFGTVPIHSLALPSPDTMIYFFILIYKLNIYAQMDHLDLGS